MCSRKTFPLISGFLSLDLVNTEVISHGRRHELLVHEQDLLDWLHTMCEEIPSLDKNILNISENETTEILRHIHEFRFTLRENFESIADGNFIDKGWISDLEKNIENAPYVYRLESDELKKISKGSTLNKILSLLSLDTLHLIAEGKLQKIKRCSNPDCVLLFIDLTGRRKWCSMKICGNRKKVARFQEKKINEK
ncbi:CGNR zinc finger domain-containing protein [Priestia flexa]|uniref:CGNR zinc finger domain-containing protein n=1 Tax=Priestia flexa TaxID=86664 RepID=UPI002E21BD4B|nr:CGNR zinc finger domain-containing protein [Priestia flexa]